jgi:phospholipase C
MATKKAAARPAEVVQQSLPQAGDPYLQNLRKVDHIVILMMENRSFDHLLGYLSLSGGRNDVDGLKGKETNIYRPGGTGAPVTVPVRHLTSTAMEQGQDPCHSGQCVDRQVSKGNTGFVQNYHDTHPNDPDPGIVMGYFQAAEVPVYDFLATEFSIGDRWFSSVLGATWPNRLYLTSGKAAGSRDNKPGPLVLLYRNKSWVRHLDANGISWKGYGDGFFGHSSIKFTDQNYRTSPNYEPFAGSLTGYGFLRDAETGQLPAVSIIDPAFFKNDDHPPADISGGQAFVARAYNALAKSPAWSRTLLIVVYDEHGGFYDHVVPGPAQDDDANFRNYGVRVPAFFIGPYVPKGRCFHATYDHASIVKTILLRFCATNGRIPDMGARVSAAAHLGEVLSEPAPRPAKALPMPTVKKMMTRRAQLAFAEFDKVTVKRPTSQDEAAFIRTTRQLQAATASKSPAVKKRMPTPATKKGARGKRIAPR